MDDKFLFRGAKEIIKNDVFFSSLVEIGVKTAPLVHPRGPEERDQWILPGSSPGDLHRVVSHPKTIVFINSVDGRAATEQLAKDTGLAQQFPAAEMPLPSRGWGMVAADELPPLSLEHELALPKIASHQPGVHPAHIDPSGERGKRCPGTHRLGSRGDPTLQGCLWSLEMPPQPQKS